MVLQRDLEGASRVKVIELIWSVQDPCTSPSTEFVLFVITFLSIVDAAPSQTHFSRATKRLHAITYICPLHSGSGYSTIEGVPSSRDFLDGWTSSDR